MPCRGYRDPLILARFAYCDRFIVTNDSEDELSMCNINITAFFLLDMFQSSDHHKGYTSHIALSVASSMF